MFRLFTGVVLASAMLGAGLVFAHEARVKTMRIVHPYTIAVGHGEGARARVSVFMKIENNGKADEALKSAASPVAEAVTLGNGESPVPSIPVPAQSAAVLTQGAYHIELHGLKKALSEYDTFPMTLEFEKAGKLNIDVLVEEAADAPAQHHD